MILSVVFLCRNGIQDPLLVDSSLCREARNVLFSFTQIKRCAFPISTTATFTSLSHCLSVWLHFERNQSDFWEDNDAKPQSIFEDCFHQASQTQKPVLKGSMPLNIRYTRIMFAQAFSWCLRVCEVYCSTTNSSLVTEHNELSIGQTSVSGIA